MTVSGHILNGESLRRNNLALWLVTVVTGLCGGHAAYAQSAPTTPAQHLRVAAMGAGDAAKTDHIGSFNGKRVAYQAVISRTLLESDKGAPAVSLVTFAYVAKGRPGDTPRPVLFAFNGGPGGSSAPMHLGALGPKILSRLDNIGFADPKITLVDNPGSPIDAVDIVFVDPANTGFSKTLDGADMSWLKSVDGDSESIARLIANWLRTNDRMDSPVFVIGESYGTMRAVALARDIPRVDSAVRLRGIILSGTAYTYGQGGKLPNPAATAARLSMMASMAWHHGKIDRTQSWDDAVDKARRFGRGDYVGALMDGHQISRERFDRVAAQLPALIGIPESYFRQRGSLIVEDFNAELLRDRGLVLDRNDGRQTGPQNVVPSRDFDAQLAGFKAAMNGYVRRDLKGGGYGDYLVLTPNLVKEVRDWNFSTTGPGALDTVLAAAMRGQKCLRLGVLQGRYDTLTNMGTTEYTLAQTDIPQDRVATQYFDGGHFLLPTREVTDFVRSFTTQDAPDAAACGPTK